MLDNARNNLIKHAFQLAGITCPESEPTAAEIDDAAHVLNVMLQSWNNDGFRLFKIKTGYMPFEKGKNEYSLAQEAYKKIAITNVNYLSKNGTNVIEVTDLTNMAKGQNLIVLNNVISNQVQIDSYLENGSVKLVNPLNISILSGNTVFYGDSFSTCLTSLVSKTGSWDTLSFKNNTTMPLIGDVIYFQYEDAWQRAVITQVNPTRKTITINQTFSEGDITSAFLVYGSNVFKTTCTNTVRLAYNTLTVNNIEFTPSKIALVQNGEVGNFMDVDYTSSNQITVKSALSQEQVAALGVSYLYAKDVNNPQTHVSWYDLLSVAPITPEDWGSITDTEDLQTDDYGRIIDPATVLEDWGTLTSSAKIKSYASINNDSQKYVVIEGTESDVLVYKNGSANWVSITSELLTRFKVLSYNSVVYLYDATNGVFELSGTTLTPVYTTTGAEAMIQYKDMYYFVSPIVSGNTRNVTYTIDFVTFATAWDIDLPSVASPAVFDDKLFIGSTDTFVTNNMRSFSNINVYSDARCVVGDRILNMNYNQYCTFSKDGINFLPMPLMLSAQTAAGYKDGCTFVAVYGVLMDDGTVGTEIYTTNDFNPVWLPQMRISGRVSDIFFDNNKAYFVSDVAVMSLDYTESTNTEEVSVCLYGDSIGRPQEVMNVIKFGLQNKMQLPMNALALKDFLLLPHETDGEPVNYCFMREAKDGKIMVWGTPNKFGEYLRFSYVEPITLLEDARSTPDFPDEYYEAVEDGLAAELAYHYQLPVDRIQALVAKAEASKEKAMLHDNEDTSYNIAPNQRML